MVRFEEAQMNFSRRTRRVQPLHSQGNVVVIKRSHDVFSKMTLPYDLIGRNATGRRCSVGERFAIKPSESTEHSISCEYQPRDIAVVGWLETFIRRSFGANQESLGWPSDVSCVVLTHFKRRAESETAESCYASPSRRMIALTHAAPPQSHS